MVLVIRTFKNERGNQIDLQIDDIPDRGAVIVRMRGPASQSVNEMTYREAAELRDALKTITI